MTALQGVYIIANTATSKVYVGSAVNLRRRWATHARDLRRGTHPNRYLQASWNRHGEAAFAFMVAEQVPDRAALVEREQWWLDALQAAEREFGYNINPTAYSTLGHKFTAEQRERVSASLKGKPKSPEHRANMLGRTVTDAQREAMAAVGRSGRGRSKPIEHRSKIGAAQQGSANHAAKLTEDDVRAIRARLSEGERGRHLAAEFGVHESIISEIKSGRRWRHVLTPQT